MPTRDPVDAKGERRIALQMKPACERCQKALVSDGKAWICSYECTFCVGCAAALAHCCPDCDGELVPRPRRADPAEVA